jgi:hypothetical protein
MKCIVPCAVNYFLGFKNLDMSIPQILLETVKLKSKIVVLLGSLMSTVKLACNITQNG